MPELLDAYPIARMQAGMIYHSELEQESGTYHDIDSYHLRAPFDEQLLRESLQHLALRHEVLRTGFDLVNFSEPLQLIYDEVKIPLDVADIRHLSETEQVAHLAAWMELEKKAPFDYTEPPLLRVQAHRRTEETFQLTLGFHHAILDGFSVAALSQELFQIYGALIEQKPLPAPKQTTSSFRDFIALEREALESETTLAYWEQEVKHLPPTGAMFGRSVADPNVSLEEFDILEGVLPAEVLDRLQQLVRQLGVPMKSVLLAAHLRVLATLTGQNNVTAGVVTHGRLEDGDGDQLLGLFLNTLPMQMDLQGGTWSELIRSVFRKDTAQMPHRRYPIADLQRLAGGQELFNTLFNFNHFHHVESSRSEGQVVTIIERTYFERVNFPLSMHFNLSPATKLLSFALCYVKAWFTKEQADVLSACYQRALETIAFSPEARYDEMELLTEAERAAVMHDETEANHLRYWQKQLGQNPVVLQLPTDRPRPVQLTAGHTGSCSVSLPESLSHALNSCTEGTPALHLLAAWQLLLSRFSGQERVHVGTPTVDGKHVLVLTSDFDTEHARTYRDLLQHVTADVQEARAHAGVPFATLVESLIDELDTSYSPLCQVLFVFPETDAQQVPAPELPYDLVLTVQPAGVGYDVTLQYNADLFAQGTIERMSRQLVTLLHAVTEDLDQVVTTYPLLSAEDRQQILVDWNNTATEQQETRCIHELFELQVEKMPDHVAIVFEDRSLTFRELNERANQVAHALRAAGVGPDTLVGLCMERSLEMMVGLLGILKSGGAYVPLDPTYPADRIAYIVEDAEAPVLLSQPHLLEQLPQHGSQLLLIDPDFQHVAGQPTTTPTMVNSIDHLAYAIYTSGSTGKPKGVLLEHKSVVNFFHGMDERIGCDERDTLLAVTSISFDISVLELFWTLTRGSKVVLLSETEAAGGLATAGKPLTGNGMEFSLFYFASELRDNDADKYRLLIEGAKFADQNRFTAVWTPERHFHAFGGLYPSPAVTSNALAMITEHIQLRSGSIVLPLHNPIRVAEDWSVVDNFSNGRVALSFASGWNANDFALQPDNYANRSQLLFENIDIVKKLWRGESVTFKGGMGQEVDVSILPRPIQKELPVFVTTSGNPGTFRRAGASGAHLLTHLLGQSVADLTAKIAIYREARAQAGYDPATGHVALMLHTFVGASREEVKEIVREPFLNYLRSSVGLIDSWLKNVGSTYDADATDDDIDGMLAFAFDRYFETSGLFGTPESCLAMVNQLKAIGVDEVACLIDFGIEESAVIDSWKSLNELREACVKKEEVADDDFSLTAQAARHDATLLQCTPSLMKIVSSNGDNLARLRSLRTLMLGGEALPASLATELKRTLQDTRLVNMYGPTEATVWATTHEISAGSERVPIGKPFANVRAYVLDEHMQPVPVGYQGELYIGGLALARGYHKRADLTAEKFVSDPFGALGAGRLYKTGDLVRYLPDGSIEFLRRMDHQVKVRGFRIELGEIESVLQSAPQVQEAVLLVREDKPGDMQLVAYLIAQTGHDPLSDQALRELVKAKLPAYMVPSAYVWLDALPLTANGKIDRRALPAPQFVASGETVEPRTEVEREVAEIWSELLGRDIGVLTSFFEAGGHSLLSIQLIARLRDRFELNSISLKDFYAAPTIEGIAAVVERMQGHAQQTSDAMSDTDQQRAYPKLEVGMGAELQSFPLTPVQENYWIGRSGYFDRGTCGSNVVQIYSVVNVGADFANRLNHALNRLIQRHDSLRLVINEDGTQSVLDQVPDYEVLEVDLQDLEEEAFDHAVEELAERQMHGNFPIDRWPLFDSHLLKQSGDRYALVLRLDAFLVEGSSLKIINEELYQLLEQPDVELPAFELSFRDYATYVAALEESAPFAADRAYWLNQLEQFPEPAELPMCGYVSPATSSDMHIVGDVLFDPNGAKRLQARAKQAGISVSAIITSAFCQLLTAWSGQEDFTLFLITTDRPPIHPEMEHILGNFNSLLPIVWRSSDETFEGQSKTLQMQLLESLEHRTYTAHHLIREWNKRRMSGSRTPAAILFNSLVDTEHNGIVVEEENLSITRHGLHWFVPQYLFKATVTSSFNGSILSNIEFVKELFPTEMVETMLATYKQWVQQLADTPLTDWQPMVTADRVLTPAVESVLKHGYRVSLRDIEQALLGLPEIKAACVVTSAEERAPMHAHVEVHAGHDFCPDAWERALANGWPPFLMPDRWYLHEELPRTAEGQIDRAACLAQSDSGIHREQFLDETETRLAAIYAELLPTAPTSRHDDVYVLGGDSLVAVRLLKRIETEFGHALPVTALVRGGSIAELASLLRK